MRLQRVPTYYAVIRGSLKVYYSVSSEKHIGIVKYSSLDPLTECDASLATRTVTLGTFTLQGKTKYILDLSIYQRD